MNVPRILTILMFALIMSACGAASTASVNRDSSAYSTGGAGEVAPPALEAGAPASDSQAAGDNTLPNQQEFSRLVIKNADMSLQVENVRDAESNLRALIGKLGGYIAKVETNGTDENMTVRVSFRIPANRFDEALSGVQGLAKKLLSRTISGDDVTEEFVDLESRLRNLEATRDRLQTFLDKATKVEDALSVNASLSEIQGQIEQTRGRMQFLKQSAALSTVSVYLTPVPTTPIIEEDSWQPLLVARRALRDLIALGQEVANMLIVLLVWIPVWVPLVLFGFWIWRRLTGRQRSKSPLPNETA